jgi:hypothetical protein
MVQLLALQRYSIHDVVLTLIGKASVHLFSWENGRPQREPRSDGILPSQTREVLSDGADGDSRGQKET